MSDAAHVLWAIVAAYATPVSTATAVGIWSVPTFGLAGFRARCSAYTSGNPVVTVRYAAS
jgi:hypothetical protein